MGKKLLFEMLCMLSVLFLLSGCGEQETATYVFEEEGVYFSIDVPLDWTVQRVGGWPAVTGSTPEETYEASPDAGLEIYVDGKEENRIYLYRQYGHIYLNLSVEEEEKLKVVQVNDTLSATHHKEERNGRILETYIFEEDGITGQGFYAISIGLPRKVYNSHKRELAKAVESITIK